MIYNSYFKIELKTIQIQLLGWAKGVYFGRITVGGKVVFEEKIALK